MTRNVYILISIIQFCSCNYKVYVNGHFSHKADKINSYRISKNDSSIVIGEKEKIPDSVIFINETRIYYGASPDSFQIFSVNYSLIQMAKEDAGICGANIIKIIKFNEGNMYKNDNIVVKMYVLKEPNLSNYLQQTDTLHTQEKSLCVLHFRNLKYNQNDIPLYLNKLLVGKFQPSIESKGQHGYNMSKNRFLDIRLNEAGILSTNGSSKYNVRVEKGKEYFIKIISGRHYTSTLQIVSKYDFY